MLCIKALLDFLSLSPGDLLFSRSNTGLVASQSSLGSVDVHLHELRAHRDESDDAASLYLSNISSLLVNT